MEKLKEDFLMELAFFTAICKRDMEKGFNYNQVENALEKFATSFYVTREIMDDYAYDKQFFVKTYIYQIIKGNDLEELVNEFIRELKAKQELGAHNL